MEGKDNYIKELEVKILELDKGLSEYSLNVEEKDKYIKELEKSLKDYQLNVEGKDKYIEELENEVKEKENSIFELEEKIKKSIFGRFIKK